MKAHPARTNSATRQRDLLHKAIEHGMTTLRRIQSDLQANPARLIELSHECVRVSAVVRRAVRLAHKLDQAEQARTAAATAHRTAVRRRLIREVEDAIQCVTSGAEAEALHQILRNRLDSPDLEAEVMCRPVADIIADMLRDLGLAPSRAYAEDAPPPSRPVPPPRIVH